MEIPLFLASYNLQPYSVGSGPVPVYLGDVRRIYYSESVYSFVFLRRQTDRLTGRLQFPVSDGSQFSKQIEFYQNPTSPPHLHHSQNGLLCLEITRFSSTSKYQTGPLKVRDYKERAEKAPPLLSLCPYGTRIPTNQNTASTHVYQKHPKVQKRRSTKDLRRGRLNKNPTWICCE